jgi:ankyrin repeat protein
MTRRVALIAGAEKYEDQSIRSLTCVDNDCTDLVGFFRYAAHFNDVRLLRGDSDREILDTAAAMVAGLSEGDLFLFYFSGHGVEKDGRHLLLCRHAQFRRLNHFKEVVPVDLLRQETEKDGVNRVFILDACRSDLMCAKDANMAGLTGERVLRDIVTGNSAFRRLGAFGMLCSCSEGQQAMEIPQIGHGLFTAALLESFKAATEAGAELGLSDAWQLDLAERMQGLADTHGLPAAQAPWIVRSGLAVPVILPGKAEATTPLYKVRDEARGELPIPAPAASRFEPHANPILTYRTSLARIGDKIRYEFTLEAVNQGDVEADWAGVTIHLPELTQCDNVAALDIRATASAGANVVIYRPGNPIWRLGTSIRDDMSKVRSEHLMIEAVYPKWEPEVVLPKWKPGARITLNVAITLNAPQLQAQIRAWSSWKKEGDQKPNAYGLDPKSSVKACLDQQGFPCYELTVKFSIEEAFAFGDFQEVESLIKRNPDLVFSRGCVGMTPLHTAALKGHTDIADLLIANKADVNALDDNGWAPLHEAAWKGHEAVARLLLANKAEVNAKYNDGWTPLHKAAEQGHLGLATLLLVYKADANACDNNGMTPLHHAALKGHKAVAELLISARAQVNARDNNGWTPLHEAAWKGHETVAKLLLANKAGVNAKYNDGWTPLHKAAEQGHLGVAKLLLAYKADADAKDNNGMTPLHHAALRGHKAVVELLISARAQINARDHNGWTPLHEVALAGHQALAELLVMHKVEVNAKNNNAWTPLHLAVEKGHLGLAKLLLAAKAEVNARCENGATPLHLSAANGHNDVSELLVNSEAEVNARNNNGWTPLREAEAKGQKHVAELLRQHGGYE